MIFSKIQTDRLSIELRRINEEKFELEQNFASVNSGETPSLMSPISRATDIFKQNVELEENDENVAEVSLQCLTEENKVRQAFIYVVFHPYFDDFIGLITFVNCLYLSMNHENLFITNHSSLIRRTILVIYTLEAIFKIVAHGFVTKRFSYLRNIDNQFDFLVVVIGWTYIKSKYGDITGLRALQVLRPMRKRGYFQGMNPLIRTVKKSFSAIQATFVLLMFTLIIFGTAGTQLLGGHMNKRCTDKAGQILHNSSGNEVFCIKSK